MSTQPRQSISNIFGGGEEAADANLKRQQKAASDIFNQTAPMAAPAAQTSGKRLYQGQRDNDIFGIRERTTGETTEVKESLLQASTSTVNNQAR